MMVLTAYLLWTTYLILSGIITIYCLLEGYLLYKYWRNRGQPISEHNKLNHPEKDWPGVTVQLPIYNESKVVDRLFESIAQLDYPTEKLEIQVIDDSSDETTDKCRSAIQKYRSLGQDWKLIHRTSRSGFKAGALQNAIHQSKFPLIAIFDADFVPSAKFLKDTTPFFSTDNIGAVQTRWGYINKDFNWLTAVQALQLNVHFTIEQKGRAVSDYFIQFNGTAGIWKKEAIEDAGGWQADTVTEDLDLSIRAQLKGWKIHYAEEITVPSELPVYLEDFQKQQARWISGGITVLRKLGYKVLTSNLSTTKKLNVLVQMGASIVYGLVYLLGIIGIPMLLLPGVHELYTLAPFLLFFYQIGFFSLLLVFGLAQVFAGKERGSIFLFPLYLINALGLSHFYSNAVFKGLFGQSHYFHRTPKYGIKIKDNPNKTRVKSIRWKEGLLSIFFITGVLYGIKIQNYYFLLLHIMLGVGFLFIFLQSFKHS